MKRMWTFFLGLVVFSSLCQAADTKEIIVNTNEGETFLITINPEESFSEVEEKVTALVTEGSGSLEFFAHIPRKSGHIKQSGDQGKYLGHPRDYLGGVSKNERADIHYIVTSLANKSLVAIAVAKSDLESAGNRIDHVHPLLFLMTIFTDEELKVGIRNIRGKGWVWKQFTSGLKESLSTEMRIGNIPDAYICDFAQKVGIDVNSIHNLVITEQWDHFIDTLIVKIPRKGDHDRYDF